MSDEFLTGGLQSDRYLKALRLVDQFEDEIVATLRRFGQRMVSEQSDLFESNPDGDERTNRSPASALAHSRINYPISGRNAPTTDQTWQLNVHLYWVAPEQYNRPDVDGALRTFGYKIKYADSDIDDEVVEQTQAEDWPIRTSVNPYDTNVAFYKHVSSGEEIKNAADILVDHFSTFGAKYALGTED